MADDIWREGDKITLEKGAKGWKAEILRGPADDGKPGGIVGNPVFSHKTPEDGLEKLRKALSND